MLGEVRTTAFSPDGFFFALLSFNGQLRVFETDTNTERLSTSVNPDAGDAADDAHLTGDRRKGAKQIVCFAWKPTTQDKKRKRAKKQSDPQILVGYSNGEVALMSVNSGATQTWDNAHKFSVTAMTWHVDAGHVFTVDNRGNIFKWSPDGSSRSVFREKLKTTRALSPGLLVQGQHTLLCAGRDILVLRVEDASEIKRISAHVSPISRVILSSRSDLQGAVSFVANDPNDRQVNVWSLDPTEKKQKLLTAIEVPSRPVDVSISSDKGALRVAVLGDNGAVYLYDGAERVHKQPTAKISARTGDVPTKKVLLLGVLFPSDRSQDTLRIARGNSLDPAFEDLVLSTPPQTEVLTRDAPLELFQPTRTSTDAKATRNLRGKQGATVLGAAQVASVQSKSADDATPLGERVESLLKSTGADKLPQGYTRDGQPKSGTLTNMLLQAIHSSDTALLDECLGSANERIVKATVARLPSKIIVPFFRKIVYKLEARPSRGTSLLVWVRSIISAHTSHLLTLPDLPDVLKDLYGMAEARLAAFPAISRLSGRLDLLLAQADRTHRVEADLAQVDEDVVPRAIYIEPEEDEEQPETGAEDEEDDDDDDNEWAPVEVPGEDDELFDDVLGMSEMEETEEEDDQGKSSDDHESDSDDEDEEEEEEEEEEASEDNAMDEGGDDEEEEEDEAGAEGDDEGDF